MKTLKKSLSISSLLHQSTTTHKHFCSSSTSLTSILYSKLKTLPSSNPQKSQEPISDSSISNDSNDLESANLPIPNLRIRQDPETLTQSQVINTLVIKQVKPLNALNYYNWVQKIPGFDSGFQAFCVILQIVADADFNFRKRNMIELISSQECPKDAAIVVQGLVETAERFDYRIKPSTFELLMRKYVQNHRIDDALVCFDAMVEYFGADLKPSYANFLLRVLIKMGRLKLVEELLNKMISNGVTKDVNTPIVLIKYCVVMKKFEEAEQLFRMFKDLGYVLGANIYNCVIGTVCMKPDMNAAYELLKEMRGMKYVPSASAFSNVIVACVKQRNMEEALRIRDEMVLCNIPVDLNVMTSLITGYCELGDFESALSLFKKSIEDELSLHRVTFSVLFHGYLNKSDMEGAIEVFNLMIKKGFKPGPNITFSLIRGLLGVQSWEKAYEQLKIAVESGSINYFQYRFLMTWLCFEGKVDEARQLWDKILETESLPTIMSDQYFGSKKKRNAGNSEDMVGKKLRPNAATFTAIMWGHFKKGEVEQALKLFDEIMNRKIVCEAYTYNTIIHGLCLNGQTSEARKMLESFTAVGKFIPSISTYNFIIEGFIREGNMESALSVEAEMREKGIFRETMLKKYQVDMLCNSTRLECVVKMVREKLNKGYELEVPAYEPIISGVCRRRWMKFALMFYLELLEKGLYPSQHIMNCMVEGYQKEGKNDILPKIALPPKKRNMNRKKKRIEQMITCNSEKNSFCLD
ncbi:pentatricopeptide repeat-containing protein At3g54980, mitochondrial-like [Chenopodium quinoa]|uniref:pentatricopeptide repeat-containing protein At3g54980, mitochondrial-like n=1 Tax=Chenopodium quinoa TaxID=63459 RepID=UPI000B795A17|nr:pentatricopeptide repeat-containing protein At3g54980, mitochondrial-like [Chenopodium quinoa]